MSMLFTQASFCGVFNFAMWTFHTSVRRKRELQALRLQSTHTFTDPSDFIASFGQYYLGLVVVGTFLKIRGCRPTSFTLVKDFTVVFPFDSASKCNLYFLVGWVLCFSDCADGIFPKTKREKKTTILTRVGIRKTFFFRVHFHIVTQTFSYEAWICIKSEISKLRIMELDAHFSYTSVQSASSTLHSACCENSWLRLYDNKKMSSRAPHVHVAAFQQAHCARGPIWIRLFSSIQVI